jgi:hypothetical protein
MSIEMVDLSRTPFNKAVSGDLFSCFLLPAKVLNDTGAERYKGRESVDNLRETDAGRPFVPC